MAYSFTAASSQYLSIATTPVTAAPLTLACWFRVNDNTTNRTLFEIGDGVNTNGFRLLVAGAITGDPIYADYVVNSGFNAQTTTGYLANTWNHAAAVFANNTSVTAILNGGGNVTTNGTALNPTPNKIYIGTRFSSGNPGLFMDGQIAEVGIWNAALTAAEVASLAKGMTCDKIRPQNLVFYTPLVRNLIDQKGGLAITNNNGATVANHPRVYA